MTKVVFLRGQRIKNGDTLPNLRVQLIEAGDPINLSHFSVSMKMQRTDGDSLVVDDAATISDESRGIVEYSWSSGETDKPGTYLLEFVADDGSGATISFPNDKFSRLYIEGGLGP